MGFSYPAHSCTWARGEEAACTYVKHWLSFTHCWTSLGKGGSRAGHAGTAPFLAPLKMPQHAVSSRGMRDVTLQHVAPLAEGACGKGNVAQHRLGSSVTQLPRSLSKSWHSRVPCVRPLLHTGSSHQDSPSCTELARGDALLLSIAMLY